MKKEQIDPLEVLRIREERKQEIEEAIKGTPFTADQVYVQIEKRYPIPISAKTAVRILEVTQPDPEFDKFLKRAKDWDLDEFFNWDHSEEE